MRDGSVLPGWPRAMRIDLAAAYVGLSESMLQAEEKAGRFPRRVSLSRGRIIWLKEDLDNWLDEKAGRPKPRAGSATDPDAPSDWDREFGEHRAA